MLLDLEEAAQQRSAEAAWTLSNPILQNLQKARGWGGGGGGGGGIELGRTVEDAAEA